MFRKMPSILMMLLIVVSTALGLSRCGSTDDAKDSPDKKVFGSLPSDWDGTSDWSGSALKVSDL